MTREQEIIEFGAWLASPPGRYLLDWELERLDEVLADLFGFHALQVGLAEVDTLRGNRMPHRWIAQDSLVVPPAVMAGRAPAPGQALPTPVALHCAPEALPFASDSLDLVVLPHTLELTDDPHGALAEVARVLRPEGRVVITGLNPASLWGLRQELGQLRRRVVRADRPPFLPRAGEFLGYWRVRDWLRLLGLQLEVAELGCYRPPFASPRWLGRFGWLETVGARSWPVFGAVYLLVAVKRVRGMRLVGLSRASRGLPQVAPAAATPRQMSETPQTRQETPR